MYLEHYGLTQKPFNLIPDTEFIYFSKVHKKAYTMLQYGLYEQTGITLITGEVGGGKTTLIRHLLKQIDRSKYTVGLINNTHDSFGDLFHWVALSLGISHNASNSVDLINKIQRFIINQYAQGKRCVLLIDEAQNLSQTALETLRLLTNVNIDKNYLLQIILVGQPELNATLKKPHLSQVTQRISAEFHLGPLTLDETYHYINHRLKIANGQSEIFSKNSVRIIHYYTGGIPRLINTLCDSALVYGFAADQKLIDRELMLEVVEDRKLSGINLHINKKANIESARNLVSEETGIDIAG